MTTVSVREAREKIAQLLDAVAGGEEVVILRRGKPAARLTGVAKQPIQFLNRQQLRDEIPPAKTPAAQVVRELRDNERY